MAKYPKGFSTKSRANRPRILIDKLKDALIENENVLKKFSCAEEVLQAIENLNRKYSKKMFHSFSKELAKGNAEEERILKNAYEKCKKDKDEYLFLGLYKNPDDWVIGL